MLTQNLKTNSSIIKEVSLTPRNHSMSEVMQNITNFIANNDTVFWPLVLEQEDYPHDYTLTFAATVTTIVALILPWNLTTAIITFVCDHTISEQNKQFITEHYFPELEIAIQGVKPIHKLRTFSAGIGVLIKIIYAFLYQEKEIPLKLFKNPFMIKLGGHSISLINHIADILTGFKQTDKEVNWSESSLYPGQGQCRLQEPHSIWHEVSANGLLDLIYLCDFINGQIHY